VWRCVRNSTWSAREAETASSMTPATQHLIGRLATDADVKRVNGGSKVSSFILAVDRSQEEADFALLRQKSR